MFLCGLVPVVVSILTLFKVQEPRRLKEHEDEAKRAHPLVEIFSARYRKRTVVNAVLLSVAIIGLWAGAVYEPAAITTLAKKAGMDAAHAAKMVSLGTGVLSTRRRFSDLSCRCRYSAERIGRRSERIALFWTGMMIAIPAAFGWAFYLENGLYPFIGALFLLGFAGGNFTVFSIWLPEQYDTRVRATAFAFCTSIGRFLGAGVNFALGAVVLQCRNTRHLHYRVDRRRVPARHSDHPARDRDYGRAAAGVNGGSRCFCTLPSAVRGSDSTRTMPRGSLKLAS